MTEKNVMEFLDSRRKLGSVPGLDNIEVLCDRLGRPQDRLKFIHIAGTNGKGSTAGFISSILEAAGYKTGLYTSPEVFCYRERYRIQHKNISINKFCSIFERVQKTTDEMETEGQYHPTVFEVETAAALLYFAEEQCDYVVLETGMGGKLDATNLVKNTVAAVFTSISMDHMQYLGNTLQEIAENKAGIIKNNCYVISGIQKQETENVLRTAAKERNAAFYIVDEKEIRNKKATYKKLIFSYKGIQKLEVHMTGMYQFENCALAVETILSLNGHEWNINEEQIRQGIVKTGWDGRFTVINEKPLFVIDGAHNPDAAEKLAQSIANYFTNKKIIYIIGILKDKEADEIIRLTAHFAEQIIAIGIPGNPRSMDVLDLAMIAKRYHNSVTAADSIEEAVEMAYLLADKDSVIIAFGSLSYLGRIRDIVDHRKKCR